MADIEMRKSSLDNLVGEVDSLVDETEFTPENIKMVTDFDAVSTEVEDDIPTETSQNNPPTQTAVNEVAMLDTLLAKAMLYRSLNPELWQKRMDQLENNLQASLGKFTPSQFLTEYYENIDQHIQEKHVLEIQHENKDPNLDVQFEYKEFRDRTQRNLTYNSLRPNAVTIFRNRDANLFEKLQSDVEEMRGDLPELVVSVQAGNQLLNGAEARDKAITKVSIKVKMYPDCLQRTTKLKTKYVALTWKGGCTFAHSFVFKGFTANELETKFIHLSLVGKNGSSKTTLGSFILAGEKAYIYIENKIDRTARANEKRALSSVLKQPDKIFLLNHEFHKDEI